MGRTILILLLSMFIFLGGVSYGAKDTASVAPVVTETSVEETYPIIEIDEAQLQPTDDELPIYQAASWFENVVITIYDFGMRVLYQFVELFF